MTWGKVVSMEEKWFSYPLSASQRWEGWNKEKKGGMEKKSNRPGFLHMPLGLFYFTTFRWVYFIIHLRDPLLPSICTYTHSEPPSPSSQSQRRNPAYSRPPSQHPTRKHPRPSTPPHRQHPPHPSWPSQPSRRGKHQSSHTTSDLHTIIRSSTSTRPQHHHLSEPVITILEQRPYSSPLNNHHFWKPIAPLRLSPRSTTHLYLHGEQRHRRHPYATEH